MKRVKIGIAGGTGGMGRWFESYFTKAGHEVRIAGRKTELTYEDLVHGCDVVILSMPLEASVRVAERIGPKMDEDQLLMDFCSRKEAIVKAMVSSTQADVIGTHPMFGPYTESIKGRNVILCPARDNHGWFEWINELLASGGAVVSVMDPKVHDQKMAVVQSLTHFLTISFARFLQKSGIIPEDAMSYATPIFRLKMNLAGRLFAQDPLLYADLVGGNDGAGEVLDLFFSAMKESRHALFAGDDKQANIFLEDIRNFFTDGFSRNALDETTRAIEAMYNK